MRVEKIEKELKAAMSAVAHVVCVGEGQRSLSVVVSLKTAAGSSTELSADAVGSVKSQARTLAQAASDGAWRAYCAAAIDKVNGGRTKDAGKVKSCIIASTSFAEGAELAGGKVNRKGVEATFKNEIAALYK